MNLRTAVRTAAPAATAAVLVVTTAACGQVTGPDNGHPASFSPATAAPTGYVYEPPSTLKASADDRKWMAAHPVPARPGMTTALVTHDALTARCTVLSKTRGYCDSWDVTVITPGRLLTITCGSQYTACTSKAYPSRTVPLRNSQPAGEASAARPDTGDYLYIPVSGTVTAAHDVIVIRRHADPAAGRF